jgi:hypothetical protein
LTNRKQPIDAAGASLCFRRAFAYNAAGDNSWATETTETLPDGTQKFVYTNAYGNVMLFVHDDGGTETINYYEYDDQERCILAANPSAVTGYDDSYADLVNFEDGNAEYLSDDTGMLTIYKGK